jgi:hypothetical protein
VLLTPGAANNLGETKPGRANAVFGLSGARPTDSRYMIDGTEFAGVGTVSNSLPNTGSQKLLGVDAIAEFNVSTNSGDATIGKEQGGQINVVTRSGTNDFHGTGYEYVRSNIFDARNPFSSTVAFLMRNNFGGAVGGPIKKDKAFFFFNFEQYRDREDNAFQASVPTLAERGIGTPGGVMQIPNATTVTAGNPCGIVSVNPTTGQVTGAAAMTGSTLAGVQASYAVMNFFPTPNGGPATLANGCPATSQLVNTLPLEHNQDTFYLGRVDYQLSAKQSVFARYLIQTGYRVAYVNDNLAQFPMYKPVRTQLFTLGDRYVFSNGLLNQFTASFNRGATQILDNIQQTPNIPSAFTLIPGYTGPTQLGVITINGLQTLNSNASAAEFHNVNRQIFEGDDQLSKTWGKHFVQTGIEVQRTIAFEENPSNFDGNVTFNPTGGSGIAAFAEGVPTSLAGVLPSSNPHRTYKQAYFGTYLQDSYRVTQNLTLNLGLRWELLTLPVESHGRMLQWYPVLGGDGACAATTICYPTFPLPFPQSFSEAGLVFPADHPFTTNRSGNFMPRLGFAWNVFGNGKTSLRGGFGMYYNQIENGWRSTEDTAPPVYSPITITSPAPKWPTPGQALVGVTSPPVGTKLSPSTVQPNPSVPAMLQYNLTIQQQIAPNTLVSVGYAGSESYHEDRAVNPQQATPIVNGAGLLQLPSLTALNAALSQTASESVFDGTGSYNAMIVTFEKRLTHGLQVKSAFSWSKTLTDAPDSLASNSPAGIPSNPRYDWGLASFSVNKTFNINGIYDLPFNTQQKFAGEVINGWQIGWIYVQQSGLPFRLTDSAADGPSTCPSCPTRPTINPAFSGPVILGQGNATGGLYFNPQAFIPEPPGVFAPGAMELSGPGLANVDISLSKTFKLTERIGMQFRADAFNALNHPNWNLPNSALFQSISCATGATSCASGTYSYIQSDGQVTATINDAREFQFGLKLTF